MVGMGEEEWDSVDDSGVLKHYEETLLIFKVGRIDYIRAIILNPTLESS